VAEVYLPRSLILLFPAAERRVPVEAVSVAEVIDRLDERWPGMRARLCDAGPAIREHINVFVDGDRAGLDTPLGPRSVVHVIPAVSGGGG
jgi:molybdopterin converting factor small subunit